MEVQSGLYGFDGEELTELFEGASTNHRVLRTGSGYDRPCGCRGGGEAAKPVYAVAQDSEGLQKLLQQANLQKGDTVTIENVVEGQDTSLALSGLPSGVKVENQTEAPITVNGAELSAGASLVIPEP